MKLCCNCKEWRGTYADEFDKCHINKCGHVRYDNYCKKHDKMDGVDIDRFKGLFEYEPTEIDYVGVMG